MSSRAASATLVGVLTIGLTTVPWLLATGSLSALALATGEMVGNYPSLFPVVLALIGVAIVWTLPILELETPADDEPALMTRFPPEDVLWPSAPERKRNHDYRAGSDYAMRRRQPSDATGEEAEISASDEQRGDASTQGEGEADASKQSTK